ncbi:MAG TPA: GNAT family N-acetyltransferase [Cyanothece sp. UBA12306]|nr:GNAT family N-acetyltransferase [Cyanothece sp. UBA12306]
MNIRESEVQENQIIQQVHLNAFGEPEGTIVSKLAVELLQDETAKPIFSFVAEENNKIVGNVIFSHVKINSKNLNSFILAPLAVTKKFQRKGIGKSLILHGLSFLRNNNANLVFVLGDPKYYSRFGFEAAIPYNLNPPYKIPDPEAWMVINLSSNSISSYQGIVECGTSLNSEEYW